jgi:hypothetical protein
MADIIVNNEYPAVQYEPASPEENGVYHEDREATLSSPTPGSQMFRTYNAQFNPGGDPPSWGFNNPDLPAYATVQNPDGSIHYFTNPEGMDTWTTWAGSGNNAVFNAVDYGMSTSDPSGVGNTAALQAAVNAAIEAGAAGGTVKIPAGVYKISGPVTISGVPGGLVIRGESAGTVLFQQGQPPPEGGSNQLCDTFDCSANTFATDYGIRFRDLTIQYESGLPPGSGTAIAINCTDSDYTTAENCAFVNCPQAFAAGSQGTRCLHSGLVGCSVYQDAYPNSTQVLLSGAEDFVVNCELFQMPMVGAPAGPGGCTGIAVGYGATACRIRGCHISDFYTGVSIGGEGHADDTWITDCKIDAAVALSIIAPNGGAIYGIYATACTFAMLEGYAAGTGPVTSGVLINQDSGSVASVVITGCIAYGFRNAGIEIDSGQNIVIVGGQYSSNGQGPSPTYLGAGTAFAGGQQVTISGADCSSINQFWQTKIHDAVKQPYALSITAAVEGLYVRGCNLTGYKSATGPVYASSAGTKIEITNCPGYNDLNTEVNGSNAPLTALSAAESTPPYYGPSLVIFSNPNGVGGWTSIDVHIGGPAIYPMGFGTIHLANPRDRFYFSTAPSTLKFRWVGK